MVAPKRNQFALGNSGPPPSKYTQEFIEQEAAAFINWFSQPENIYFKRFALERGYPPDVLADFAKKNEVFKRAYLFAKEWQECKIVEGALFNKLNSNFANSILRIFHNLTHPQRSRRHNALRRQLYPFLLFFFTLHLFLLHWEVFDLSLIYGRYTHNFPTPEPFL